MVAKAITLPNNGNPATKFSYDINGDGKPDNQFASIVTALGAAGSSGPNPQQSTDNAVAAGQLVLLFHETGASLSSTTCAETVLQEGVQASAPPKFDGTDTFMLDNTATAGTFLGPIVGSTFTSTVVPAGGTPVSVSARLQLIVGSTPVPITIIGARTTFTKTATGATAGVLHGAVKYSEVQANIVPALADAFTASEQNDPSGTSGTIGQLFDTGVGCKAGDKNRDGTTAAASDGKVAVCEVVNNSLIKSILVPDVQLFDSLGNWAPNPANTKKDAMSIGFGFQLVDATF